MIRKCSIWLFVVLAVVAAGCGSDSKDSSATATSTTTAADEATSTGPTPFDSPDVFCTPGKSETSNGKASDPGVTADSITLVDSSLDSAEIMKLGVDIADFHSFYQAFVDQVNTCGGIHGRKLVLKSALFNPLAPNLPAHIQAQCLKATEDYKAFFIFDSIGGPPFQRCVAIQHQAVVDAGATVLSTEFADSDGRILSQYPAGDKLAQTFIADGVARDLFKGKTITVVGLAYPTPLAPQEQTTQYVDELKKHGIDANIEILPCAGRDCSAGVNAAVNKIKQHGTDMIVLTHYFQAAQIGPFFREMKTQGLDVTLTGPFDGSLDQDSVLPQTIASAGSDAMAYIAEHGWTATFGAGPELVGEWRTGEVTDTPVAKMCHATLAKALGQAPYQFVEKDINNSRWGSGVSTCASVRNVARALWKIGPNVTTARFAKAMADMKAIDRRETTPYPRAKAYFSGTDVQADKVTTLTFHYPCPAPKDSTTAAKTGCFMPDFPITFRKVRY